MFHKIIKCSCYHSITTQFHFSFMIVKIKKKSRGWIHTNRNTLGADDVKTLLLWVNSLTTGFTGVSDGVNSLVLCWALSSCQGCQTGMLHIPGERGSQQGSEPRVGQSWAHPWCSHWGLTLCLMGLDTCWESGTWQSYRNPESSTSLGLALLYMDLAMILLFFCIFNLIFTRQKRYLFSDKQSTTNSP